MLGDKFRCSHHDQPVQEKNQDADADADAARVSEDLIKNWLYLGLLGQESR